jgi:hypothetical protein
MAGYDVMRQAMITGVDVRTTKLTLA